MSDTNYWKRNLSSPFWRNVVRASLLSFPLLFLCAIASGRQAEIQFDKVSNLGARTFRGADGAFYSDTMYDISKSLDGNEWVSIRPRSYMLAKLFYTSSDQLVLAVTNIAGAGVNGSLHISLDGAQTWHNPGSQFIWTLVISAVSDDEGSIWMDSKYQSLARLADIRSNGLYRFENDGITFSHERPGNFGVTMAGPVIGKDGTIYYSNDPSSIFISSDKGQNWNTLQSSCPEGAKMIAAAENGTLYLSHGTSLYKWDTHESGCQELFDLGFSVLEASTSSDGTIYAAVSNGAVLEVDSANDSEFKVVFEDPQSVVYSIQVTHDDRLFIAAHDGGYLSTTPVGSTFLTSTDHKNIPSKIEMNVWPNPARSQLNIRAVNIFGQAQAVLSVTDLLGRRIHLTTFQHTGNSVKNMFLDTRDWSPGVYVLRLSVGGQVAQHLIVHI